jgi:small-conductance mechanosensitive channel
MLDEINKQVEAMSEDELRAEFAKAQKERLERKAKQKEYNTSPEAKEKRASYQAKRNAEIMADPDKRSKIVEQRKAYMSRPEVKEKQKAYRTQRNAKISAVLARAKELGIDLSATPTA